MKYYIAVEEIRSTVVEIETDNEEQALFKAENAYSDDEICLDNVGYIDDGTCFYNETDKWKQCIENGYETRFQRIK